MSWASRATIGVVLVAISFLLQGCALTDERQSTGAWTQKASYLVQYEANWTANVTESTITVHEVLRKVNSCEGNAPTQCSGNGICKDYLHPFPLTTDVPIVSFCFCDVGWADPECGTKRLSQRTAFIYATFLAWLGMDQFYLGFLGLGIAKAIVTGLGMAWLAYEVITATTGKPAPLHRPKGSDQDLQVFSSIVVVVVKVGLVATGSVWWVYDMMRIGSTAVYCQSGFKVKHDLSEWMFVYSACTFSCFIGFALSILSIERHRVKKAREVMILQNEALAQPQNISSASLETGMPPPSTTNYSSFGGYGAIPLR